MARFQIHENAKVSELTDGQITALTSYLSTPSAVVDPMSRNANNPATLGAAGAGPEGRMRLATKEFLWRGDHGRSPRAMLGVGAGVSQSEMLKRLKELDDKRSQSTSLLNPAIQKPEPATESNRDVLVAVLVENEARRQLRENLAHHRNVGSYVGRRHAMGYPVRGQRTTTNASTARKLNKIERRG